MQAYVYNASLYYRPVYLVALTTVKGATILNQNATYTHLNNGWVAGTDAPGSFTTNYVANSTYLCWYNNQNLSLPAGENFVYFSYDVSEREADFIGYMVSGIVMLSMGAVAIGGSIIACFIWA